MLHRESLRTRINSLILAKLRPRTPTHSGRRNQHIKLLENQKPIKPHGESLNTTPPYYYRRKIKMENPKQEPHSETTKDNDNQDKTQTQNTTLLRRYTKAGALSVLSYPPKASLNQSYFDNLQILT
jgi:hypothetical protein